MVDTHTSNPTGNAGYWSDANSWTSTGGGIPTAGDSVVIAANHTIYYDVAIANQVSLAGLTVTGTLRAVTASTPAGNLNSVAPASRTGLGLTMTTNISIQGTGALYIGNSTTDYIAQPAAAATYNANFILTLTGSGVISVSTQRYYGYIPTFPTAHPAWTTLSADASASQPTIVLTDDMALQQGDILLVGIGGTAGPMAVGEATTIDYPATAGVARGAYVVGTYVSATKTVTLKTNLATARLSGDFVAIYGRPIVITKAAFNSGASNIASGIMQGTYVSNMRFCTKDSWQYTGCTVECGNNSLACLGQIAYNTKFIDCVANYGNAAALAYNDLNNYYSGCAGFNGNTGGLSVGSIGNIYLNCVAENNAFGLTGGNAGDPNSTHKFINCSARANTIGCLSYSGCDNTFINCTSAVGGSNDIGLPKGRMRLYGCTLSTTPMVTGYSGTNRASWETIQSYDHAGSAGARRCWCSGGSGATGAYSSPYNAFVNPMKFTVEIQNTSKVSGVLIWDIDFEMPANKSLTIACPMARDTTNIAAELWVVSTEKPPNDPLWFDQCWQVTPTQSTSCATMSSATTTYVVGHAALTAGTGTWQNVTVKIPAYAYSRKLTARIIGANNTAAAGNFYADIDTLEKMLLKKRTVFL